MCTIVVAKNVFESKDIVVAANRDELLDRPSETPKIREDGIRILAPKDLVRGGVWIGVNEYGVLVGLTNRLNVKSVKGRTSRGKLVTDGLHCHTAQEAFEQVSSLQGNQFNGFYMVIADRQNLYYVGGNGTSLETSKEVDGVLVISNHGVGREIQANTSRRVANVLLSWMEVNTDPSPENLKQLLNIHDVDRYGTCINQPENNYGTKSSSIIHLEKDHWKYWHRERSSNQHICQDPFILQPVLTLTT